MNDWRTLAVAWLRGKAAEQAQNNERWPRHAACYPSWVQRVEVAQRLAEELEADQEAAPFGYEPWEAPVINRLGDTLRPEWQAFAKAMHEHLMKALAVPVPGLAAPDGVIAGTTEWTKERIPLPAPPAEAPKEQQ